MLNASKESGGEGAVPFLVQNLKTVRNFGQFFLRLRTGILSDFCQELHMDFWPNSKLWQKYQIFSALNKVWTNLPVLNSQRIQWRPPRLLFSYGPLAVRFETSFFHNVSFVKLLFNESVLHWSVC